MHHGLLTNRYYLGVVTYKGVEYPGLHDAIISAQLFDRVQQRLEANRNYGTRNGCHIHYLSGSLYCDNCGERLVYAANRGRSGKIYEYDFCIGRQTRRTNCDAPHFAVHRVEEAIEDVWLGEHQNSNTEVAPDLRDELVGMLRTQNEEAHRKHAELS